MPKQRSKRHCPIKQRIYYIYSIYCIYNIYLHAIGQQGQSRTLGQGQDSGLYPIDTESLLSEQSRSYKGLTGPTSPKGIAHSTLHTTH